MANEQFSQPCWCCKNFAGGCKWSSKHPEPVDGWIAIPVIKTKGNYVFSSYKILYCPEFQDDGTKEKEGTATENYLIPLGHTTIDFDIDGQRLKNAISARGFSVYQFAERSGVSPSALKKYFTGVCNPKKPTLKAIARTLGTSYEFLCEEIRKDDNE